MNNAFDPKEFWQNKLPKWEEDRYGANSNIGLSLEGLANKASNSIRYRMSLAFNILAPHVPGKRIIEIGCGSGQLAEPLIKAGAESYLGLDFAADTIKNAQARADASTFAGKIIFADDDISKIRTSREDISQTDIIFSLGLFDWLSLEQINDIFNICPNADYFHSYSEHRQSLSQFIHRIYVHIAYGYKNKNYVPQYYHEEDISTLAKNNSNKPFKLIRDKRLSFGTIITSLQSDP